MAEFQGLETLSPTTIIYLLSGPLNEHDMRVWVYTNERMFIWMSLKWWLFLCYFSYQVGPTFIITIIHLFIIIYKR